MEEELLDIVNSNDAVIGTILRSQYYNLEVSERGNIRCAEMLIQNDQGKLWIPKRTAFKRLAPSALDYSMGGHVSAGETYIESALREIHEELNLDLVTEDLIFIKKFTPSNIPYFRALYIYKSNDAPDYNTNDYESAEWLTPRELMDKIEAGVLTKSSMPETILYLLASKS